MFQVRRQRTFFFDNPNNIITVNANADISILEITHDNVDRVTDFRSKEHVERFHRFLNEGQCGIYAIENAKVIGHAWAIICRKKKQRANGYFELHEEEALIHYCNVKKSFRGRRIYPFMLVMLSERLFRQAGINRVFVDTEADNTASIRGIEKVGFEPGGQYFYLQFRDKLIYKRNITEKNLEY